MDDFYTSTEAAQITGCSRRQLQYWQEKGVVVPTVNASGKGRNVYYSEADLLTLAVMEYMLSIGLSFELCREALETLKAKESWLFDNSVPIPHEIQGWNWGAFFLPHIWAITNQVWIGLFAFVPIIGTVMGFVLAAKGNEWAWKSRRWHSIEQFKDHQRAWTKAGLFIGIPMVWIPALYTLFNLF